MLRSMFSAISGLRSHQTYLDIIGNNIANVNTTGFKASRATFSEALLQTTRGGTAPGDTTGGVNPIQVGLGTGLAGADRIFSQGDLRSTGKASDLAVEGNGFFIYSDGQRNLFSRDGALDVGLDGTLLNPATGLRVMGWLTDPTTGKVDTSGQLSAITIPTGNRSPAQATENASFSGNLDSRVATGTTLKASLSVYDSLGNPHTVNLTFTRNAAANTWDWTATAPATDTAFQTANLGSGQLVFDTKGAVSNGGTASINLDFTGASGAADGKIALDFSRITQVADEAQVNTFERDGSQPGAFIGFAIDAAGIVSVTYSNGEVTPIAQLALADFKNPGGLLGMGNNLYEMSPNSGEPQIGQPGGNGMGKVDAGFLEMSNVDLAQQFTNMIVASRGFQANSRIISVADEMLQELVNLRR